MKEKNRESAMARFIIAIVVAMGSMVLIFCLGYVLLLGGLFLQYDWEQRTASRGFRDSTPIGNAIIVQLETYKFLKGEYPETLEELVEAGLLPKIEQPTWGERKWRHSRDEEGAFYLASTKDGYPIMYYESADGGWSYDS